jgi:hypothetical protein
LDGFAVTKALGAAVKQFWVVGGEYTDTHFREIVGGGAEARYGPFEAQGAAEAEWQKRSWPGVDNCNTRFRIVETEDKAQAERKFWVVGGEYIDTHFRLIVGGGAETWAGPFATMAAATAEWQQRSWQTVDNCNARFRIVEAQSPPAKSRPR